jgi:trans-2,3-dihydro-3-hydroxyanthranilate isomerase
MEIEYHLVDVFTETALEGNALAVFTDAGSLEEHRLQQVARELNLSETTFVYPPSRADSAARVRIFTPAHEMNFAGHPTIGTAYVLRHIGVAAAQASAFELEENIGLVPVRVEGNGDPMIWLRTPPIKKEGTYDRAMCAAALHLQEDDLLADIPCGIFSAGNPNLYVAVRDRARVDGAQIDPSVFSTLRSQDGPVCMYVFAPTAEGAYSRMFAPELGVVEDPATGSAAGPLAAFMLDVGLRGAQDSPHFTIEQGTKMGRRSFLHVLVHGQNACAGIEVGGHVVPVARATMTLD